jgi:hypothetical protein
MNHRILLRITIKILNNLVLINNKIVWLIVWILVTIISMSLKKWIKIVKVQIKKSY